MMNINHQDRQWVVTLSAAREACIARQNACARVSGGHTARVYLKGPRDPSTTDMPPACRAWTLRALRMTLSALGVKVHHRAQQHRQLSRRDVSRVYAFLRSIHTKKNPAQ